MLIFTSPPADSVLIAWSMTALSCHVPFPRNHSRACPGHPRLSRSPSLPSPARGERREGEDVDARDRRGHDGGEVIRSHSEVGSLCLRHRIFPELEKCLVVQVVLRANRFAQRTVYLLPPRPARPRRIERTRIFNRHGRFDRVSAVDDLPALHHMKVLGVRRAVIVHKAILVLDEADGVDNKLAVLVMAYGLAEPTRLWIFA